MRRREFIALCGPRDAFSVSLYPKLAYKPDVDFEPIGLVFQQPNVIVARKDFPAKDLKEFIFKAMTSTYASASPTSAATFRAKRGEASSHSQYW